MINEKINFKQALKEIVNALRQKKSLSPVFYFGAGASAAVGLPSAKEFLNLLKLRVTDPTIVPPGIDTFSRLGDWAIAENCKDKLEQEIGNILSAELDWILHKTNPSLIHYVLAHLPGNFDIVTTNYDNLIEWYLQKEKRVFERFYLNQRLSSISDDKLVLLKIHGSITLTGHPEGHLIVGRQELIDFDRQNPQFWKLLSLWLQHRPFIFVGHSLEDDNLFRLLVQVENRDCESFAVDPFPDDIKMSIWRKLNINYIKDKKGQNVDAEAFFVSLFKQVTYNAQIKIQKSKIEDFSAFKNYKARNLTISQSRVGQVFSELDQGLLYEHPELARLETDFQWGERAVVLGEGGTGKTALAVMLAEKLQKSRRVYYLTAKELDINSNEVLQFLGTVVPRDLVILDDLHRLGGNLGILLKQLQNTNHFRSNILLLSRHSLLSSDFTDIEKFLERPAKGRLVEIEASDINTQIVSHRLARKKFEKLRGTQFVEERNKLAFQYQDEVEQFQEIFGNNLIALTAAVDHWQPGVPISTELSYYRLLQYLKELKNELGEDAVWDFLATCAFWQYERNISLDFFKRIGVDLQIVESLCKRGDLRAQEGKDNNKYIGGFHAQACKIYLKAVTQHLFELVSKERVKAISYQDEEQRQFKLDVLFLVKSLEWGLEQAGEFDTHFVYQGYRNEYMDILEQSLSYLECQTTEAAKRNSLMWLTLGTIYRRTRSREFNYSIRCYKQAKKLIKAEGKPGNAHFLLGRLYYEKGYIRFLKRQYIRAALLFRRSYLKDWRPGVIEQRRKYGWMSKLQMVVALWYKEWEWQMRFSWLFSLFPFIKRTFDKKLHDMFEECIGVFENPKDQDEYRFLSNVKILFAQYYLYKTEILHERISQSNYLYNLFSNQIEKLLSTAEKLLEEGHKFEKEINIYGREVGSLANEGWIYFLKGNYDEAFYLLKKSTQIAEEISKHEGLSHTYYLLGKAAEKFEEYSEAKAAYRRALDLDKNLNNGFWQQLARKRLRQLLKMFA